MVPDFFRRLARPLPSPGESPAKVRTDVARNGKDHPVRAEIPGLKRADIRVTVDRDFVPTSAEIEKECNESKAGGALARELFVGNASGGISPAHETDAKAVVAGPENRLLKLLLPKREGSAV